MVREIGISLFLACVGLGAGKGFIETIINEGGYVWIAYGAIITLLPLLIVGIIGRYVYKLNYLVTLRQWVMPPFIRLPCFYVYSQHKY